jgi:hypothetical protein
MKSIPEVSQILKISLSTIRLRLKEFGFLRSRKEGIRVAVKNGKFGNHMRGKKRVFSDEWKRNLSTSLRKSAELRARGTSIKPNGYVEYTRGPNKGRSVHAVAMEEHIGRRLLPNEVVHHIDDVKTNNDISNLKLMTRSEHASHHALENYPLRKKSKNGQFK